MKQTMKRYFTIILSVLLLLSLVPANALAMQTDVGSILQAAYSLPEGAQLPSPATLTGRIVEIQTPYDDDWENLTVIIEIPGYEHLPIWCYRLSGEGAESLKLFDTITVTGILANYRGTIEFMQGCTLDAVETGPAMVYCQAPDSWEQCYLYWKSDSEQSEDQLPSVQMERDHNGIWYAEVPESVIYLGFHNGCGEQSPKWSAPIDENVMYLYEVGYWTTYGWVELVTDYFVAGVPELCGSAWDPCDYENCMSANEDGTYSKSYTGVAAGTYELKVTNGTWDKCWGADEGMWNYCFEVEQDNSTVTISFDPVAGRISSTVKPAPIPGTQTYYLVGYINGQDHGYGEDAANMGDYRFEYGELTVHFEYRALVALKTEGNERWLSVDNYSEDSSALFSETWRDGWMSIPGGVELTLRLTEHPDGSVTLSYEWPSDAAIVDFVYGLDESLMCNQRFTLTGEIVSVNTPYHPDYDNITVTICVPNRENKPIRCYRLSGEGAETLNVGDTITVSGYVTNYMGTIEFMQGCSLDAIIDGIDPGPEPLKDPCQIVDAAYELAPGQSLPYMVTLTGTVTEIVTPYDENYKNITVNMVVEGREHKPITCYRMRGDETAHVTLGEKITVNGTLQNYAKYDYDTGELLYTTIELYPSTLVERKMDGAMEVFCHTFWDWSDCYVYWWGSDLDPQWPGIPMSQNSDGIWHGQIPAQIQGLVFSNALGEQSPDLYVSDASENMYLFDENRWSEYYVPEKSYYLIGYINGQDYGFAEDYANMGQYRFENGRLTATFTQDSYIFIKTSGNCEWFMPEQYVDGTYATFKNANNGYYDGRMRVPGNVPLVFTLVENPDGSLEVSYQADDREDWGPDSLAIVGDGIPGVSVWDPGDPAGDLTEVADNVFTKILDVPAGTDMMFKFAGNDRWDNIWNFGSTAIEVNRLLELESGDVTDAMYLSVMEDCRLKVTVDLNGMRDGGKATLLIERITPPVLQRKLTVIPPSGWTEVNLYTWSPELFGTFPGAALEKKGTAYEMRVPVTMSHLVLSGNENYEGIRQQTGDIQLECNTEDVTIRIDEDCTYAVFYGTVPEPTRRLIVDVPGGWSDVYAYTWDPVSFGDWPGTKMEQCGDTYELQIPVSTTNLIINGATDDGMRDHTDDLELVPGPRDVLIRIGQSGEQYLVDIIYGPDPDTRKVYVIAPDSWGQLYAYTWEPEELGTYPGTELLNFSGVYEMTVRNSMVNLIISGCKQPDGTYRMTQNIYLEPNGKDVTVIINEDGTVGVWPGHQHYGILRVVGSADWMGYWDPACDLGRMELIGSNKYQKCFQNVQPGRYEFKITCNGRWENSLGQPDGTNFVFTVGKTCDVTVTLTFVDGRPYVDVEYEALCIGDVTGDDKLNLGDVAKLYSHIRGNILLTDEMTLLSADFTGDGKLNIGDIAGIYAYVRGDDKASVVDAAYRLEMNQQLPSDNTLTGEVVAISEPYDAVRDCITVTIAIPGRIDKPIICSRLTGEDAEKIQLGDIVTVTGRIRNFYGAVEFKEGCRLLKWEEVFTRLELMQQTVDAAYALGRNEAMDHEVTLDGTVISVDSIYDPVIPYIHVTIAVEGREDQPIFCYRLIGGVLDYVKVGRTLTVTGTLRNYNGVVEFEEGCYLTRVGNLD